MASVTQVFFVILCGDVMIPCCYDIIVDGNALDFLNLSIFIHFLLLNAVKVAVIGKIFQKKPPVIF